MPNPFRYFNTSPEIIRLLVMMYVRFTQWQWHLDEVFVRINGETCYLWRAVDQEGEVLEAFVTKRRDCKAALGFLRKAMKRNGCSQVIVTDRLRSYQAAMREIGNETRQLSGRWLNNRAENSHRPCRRQECVMMKFRSMKSLQKFVAVHASVHNHFNQLHHLYSRKNFKLNRSAALAEWRQMLPAAGRAVIFVESAVLV